MNLGHVLFSPNGRIGQQDYWIGVLILVVGNIATNFLPFIGFLLWLGLIWVGVAVYGKRLHDAGKSAWLHVIPWALSLLLAIVGAVMVFGGAIGAGLMSDGDDLSFEQLMTLLGAGGTGLIFIMLSQLVWIIYTIWVGLLKGDAGENAYGSAPGADAATAANMAAATSAAGAPPAAETATPAPVEPAAPAEPAEPEAPSEMPKTDGDAPKS